MSLVGFTARNHPQQTARRDRAGQPDLWGELSDDTTDAVDDRALPATDFARLNRRFRFTIDAAASAANARLPRYWTRADDALRQSWAAERVWCNPPFSDLESWIVKASSELHSADLIVMLAPANRTEQGFWQRHIEPVRDRGAGLTVEFLSGRLRFIGPGQSEIGPNERPPFGCCLLIWQ